TPHVTRSHARVLAADALDRPNSSNEQYTRQHPSTLTSSGPQGRPEPKQVFPAVPSCHSVRTRPPPRYDLSGLYACRLDEPRPAIYFFELKLFKCLGCTGDGRPTLRTELTFRLIGLHGMHDGSVKPVDDIRRCAVQPERSDPSRHLVSFNALLGNGGNVRVF